MATAAPNDDSAPSADELRAAIEALEALAADRSLLAELSLEERTRLLAAAGEVFHPDAEQRRRAVKAIRRREKAAKLERDESVLAETGIRLLRARPVFTTPNVFPPGEFEQRDVEPGEVTDPQHCYVCKEKFVDIHPFYDQMCGRAATSTSRSGTKRRTCVAGLRSSPAGA